MVAITRTHVPLPDAPLESPRDWSARFDNSEPPMPGEVAFVVMLVGVRRKAKWQPRTLDDYPPLVHLLGSCCLTWTRDRNAARNDCHAFNEKQLLKANHGGKVELWGAVGWGVCGYDVTVRVVNGGGQ